MKQITIKTICEATGLAEHQVRYRLQDLKIEGKKIHPTLYLYNENAIEKVKKWQARQGGAGPGWARRGKAGKE